MDKKIANRIINTADGRYLVNYIAQQILLLDSLQGITDVNNIQAEVIGRQNAIDTLTTIFTNLVSGKDYEDVKKVRNEYSMEVDM